MKKKSLTLNDLKKIKGGKRRNNGCEYFVDSENLNEEKSSTSEKVSNFSK